MLLRTVLQCNRRCSLTVRQLWPAEPVSALRLQSGEDIASEERKSSVDHNCLTGELFSLLHCLTDSRGSAGSSFVSDSPNCPTCCSEQFYSVTDRAVRQFDSCGPRSSFPLKLPYSVRRLQQTKIAPLTDYQNVIFPLAFGGNSVINFCNQRLCCARVRKCLKVRCSAVGRAL